MSWACDLAPLRPLSSKIKLFAESQRSSQQGGKFKFRKLKFGGEQPPGGLTLALGRPDPVHSPSIKQFMLAGSFDL